MAPPRRARASKAKEAKAKAKATPGKTNKNLNDAKWRTSDAKKVVAQAFIDGIIPLELKPDTLLDTKDIFDSLFKDHPDFKDFPYEKDAYDGRFERIRSAIHQRLEWADLDSAALKKDRRVHPERKYNSKGEINWKGSEADFWLKHDVMEEGLHHKMKPQALRASRPCYQLFSKKRFSKRINQMLENDKDFGETPGQSKTKKKKDNPRVHGDPKKSLLLSCATLANDDDYDEQLTDSDASDSDF